MSTLSKCAKWMGLMIWVGCLLAPTALATTSDAPIYKLSVINRTGYTIYYVYTSPSGMGSWSEDLLGEEIISNDDAMLLESPAGCLVDIKVIDEDDDTYYKWNVDICENSKVIFEISDLADESDTPGGGRTITFANNTGYPVWYLYSSVAGANTWSDDLLGDEVVIDGGTLSVMVPGSECRVDLNAVDNEDDSYVKYNVDICANPTQAFTLSDLNTSSSNPGSASTVTIVNETGYEVFYIYISPSSASEWGEDLLETDTLESGDQRVFSLNNATCIYDIRLQDEDEDTYTRSNVDLCQQPVQQFNIEDLDSE